MAEHETGQIIHVDALHDDDDGAGATLTGRGGDLIIIDDPLKPIDALSESKRNAANEWFLNTVVSRLDDKRLGPILGPIPTGPRSAGGAMKPPLGEPVPALRLRHVDDAELSSHPVRA